MMENLTEDMKTWFEIYMLQNRYIGHLDNNRLEAWPTMFTEDCTYEIVPKENADPGCRSGSSTARTSGCCATAWCRCGTRTSTKSTRTGT